MQLISEVQAQEVQAEQIPQNEFSLTSFMPLIFIFIVFYFLIIRPQSKKIKEHKELVDSIKVGDKVTTNSGIIGKVISINKEEDIVELEIADDVTIKIIRGFIADKKEKKEKKELKKSKK